MLDDTKENNICTIRLNGGRQQSAHNDDYKSLPLQKGVHNVIIIIMYLQMIRLPRMWDFCGDFYVTTHYI